MYNLISAITSHYQEIEMQDSIVGENWESSICLVTSLGVIYTSVVSLRPFSFRLYLLIHHRLLACLSPHPPPR